MRLPLPPIASLILVVGCSAPDPATSRLEPGQRVMVPESTDPAGPNTATIEGPGGEAFPADHPASKWPMLVSGDQAVVISDEADDRDAGYRGRWTVIRVAQIKKSIPGYDLAGVECRVPRKKIRPITDQE